MRQKAFPSILLPELAPVECCLGPFDAPAGSFPGPPGPHASPPGPRSANAAHFPMWTTDRPHLSTVIKNHKKAFLQQRSRSLSFLTCLGRIRGPGCFRFVDLWQILDLKHKIETRFLFSSTKRENKHRDC